MQLIRSKIKVPKLISKEIAHHGIIVVVIRCRTLNKKIRLAIEHDWSLLLSERVLDRIAYIIYYICGVGKSLLRRTPETIC